MAAFVNDKRRADEDLQIEEGVLIDAYGDQVVDFNQNTPQGVTAGALLGAGLQAATDPEFRGALVDSAKRVKNTIGNLKSKRARRKEKVNRNDRTKLKAKPSDNDGNGDSGSGGDTSGPKRRRRRSGGGGSGGPGFPNGAPFGLRTQGIPQISYSSGIRAGVTVNRRSVTDTWTPLYLASGSLMVNNDPRVNGNPIWSYLEEDLHPIYANIIALKTNKYVDVDKYFTKAGFSAWFQTITKSLQIFYTLDSVRAYYANGKLDNINPGMDYLASHIDANVTTQLDRLQRMLHTIPIHPRLLEYVRWICQNYRVSNTPHAAVIRLNCYDMFSEKVVNDDNSQSEKMSILIDECIEELKSMNNITSYMLQAFSHWLTPLPLSSNVAEYDLNFWTFWHNISNCYIIPEQVQGAGPVWRYTKEVMSDENYFNFHVFQRDETVDGLIFASCSNFFPVNMSIQGDYTNFWGFWGPWAERDTSVFQDPVQRDNHAYSLKCYTKDSQILSVQDIHVRGDAGVFDQAYYSSNNDQWEPIKKGMPGRVRLQANNAQFQREAFETAVRLLLSAEG